MRKVVCPICGKEFSTDADDMYNIFEKLLENPNMELICTACLNKKPLAKTNDEIKKEDGGI